MIDDIAALVRTWLSSRRLYGEYRRGFREGRELSADIIRALERRNEALEQEIAELQAPFRIEDYIVNLDEGETPPEADGLGNPGR